ncbi:DUF2577 family protein [Selenomonas ruminantium]|uniref:DUF2577 family protein n=1 Tax=Selenomonas ruminantium TaxID=971 RepID=UPI0026F18418|nr:DUF2577 family protein [Selenomonas ruminantium]
MAMSSDIPSAEQSAAMLVNLQHQIAQEHTPLLPTVGRVITPPPNLSVQWNDIVITKEQIYLNEYWLPGHTRTHRGHIVSETQPRAGGGGYAEFASHTHDIDNDYTDSETLTDTLKPGDFVSVYPQDGGQLFIIESKLVKL